MLFSVKGRLGRSKYQNHYILSLGVIALSFFIYEMRFLLGIENIAFDLVVGGLLVALLSMLSAAIRRLHDLDRPAWHLLLALVPLYNCYLVLSLLCMKGEAEVNPYGLRPEPL